MATATLSPSITASTLLPMRPFLVDGLFCTAVGAASTFASGPISTFMGLPSSLALIVIGGTTLLYGLVLTAWTMSRPVPRPLGWIVLALNEIWLIGSILLLTNVVPLTDGGRWLVVLVGIDVAALAIWQWRSLRVRTDLIH